MGQVPRSPVKPRVAERSESNRAGQSKARLDGIALHASSAALGAKTLHANSRGQANDTGLD